MTVALARDWAMRGTAAAIAGLVLLQLLGQLHRPVTPSAYAPGEERRAPAPIVRLALPGRNAVAAYDPARHVLTVLDALPVDALVCIAERCGLVQEWTHWAPAGAVSQEGTR